MMELLVETPSSPVTAEPIAEPQVDPEYAKRLRALQEPLKPPPPLSLKEVWRLTVQLIRIARLAQQTSVQHPPVADRPANQL